MGEIPCYTALLLISSPPLYSQGAPQTVIFGGIHAFMYRNLLLAMQSVKSWKVDLSMES